MEKFLNIMGRIRSLVFFPFRILAFILGIPNFKVLYKSGHVEYLFWSYFSMTPHPKEMQWHNVTGSKTMIVAGVDDIVAVFQLY